MSIKSQVKAGVKKAFRIANEFLVELNLEVKAESIYDTRNPTASPIPTYTSILGIEAEYDIKDIDGDKVRQGDRRFYVDPDTFNEIIEVKNIFKIEGIDYRVIKSKPIQADVLLELQLRSGG